MSIVCNFIANHVHLYRPSYIEGLVWNNNTANLTYRLGDLRASLFGIRIPTKYALGILVEAGKIYPLSSISA